VAVRSAYISPNSTKEKEEENKGKTRRKCGPKKSRKKMQKGMIVESKRGADGRKEEEGA
jgi:hypothetical protein